MKDMRGKEKFEDLKIKRMANQDIESEEKMRFLK
jgi:hypothetical protein